MQSKESLAGSESWSTMRECTSIGRSVSLSETILGCKVEETANCVVADCVLRAWDMSQEACLSRALFCFDVIKHN